MRFRKGILAGVVGLMCLGGNDAWAQQNRGLLQEVYSDIGGMQVADLTAHPSFPAQPSSEAILESFEAPTNVADNYGQRVRGFVLPPQTGDYVFWLASDDGGALFLSADDSPDNKVEIATVPGWASSRQWNKFPQQESEPIRLESGRRYYVEALMKEQFGGDNLAVRWRLPDGTIEEPIPNERLRPAGLGPPEITEQPQNLTVTEGEEAVFSVSLTRNLGVSFQWQRNGTDIPGANGSDLEIESASIADNGAVYRVVIANADGTTTSRNASLTVRRDTAGPELVSVVNPGGNALLTIVFSEPLDAATASEAGNYVIEPGVSVLEARLTGAGNAVSLRTTTLTPGVNYRIFVNNVRDRAAVPNAVASNSSLPFSWDFDPLPIEVLIGRSEPPGPSSRTTGLVITEIHYHPATTEEDPPDLEFVELHNSQQWSEDLGGFRLSGDVDFTFPDGAEIGAGEYLVIAASPQEVADHYGIQNVLGPWEGALPNREGTVRLRHRAGALLLEVEYQDRGEWPAAADGFGHSLVLAKPSFGERNPEAWKASFLPGGSPGKGEPEESDPYRSVMINEFLAHTDDPVLDFVELYNYSNQSVDLSGCRLADDPEEDGYVFPEGTMISARGFLSLDQNALGFSLRSRGEWIVLRAPESGRVVDALRFSGQANGVSIGRFPDGARQWSPLTSFTPGQANTSPAVSEVVINELMYHPLSDEEDGEYVELHNPTTSAVDLSGWRLADEVEYRFPEGSHIPAGGYLVVAKDADYLTEHYPNLNESNTLGDFSGSLSNNRGRVALERPDLVEMLSETGETIQDTIWITVDEVIYHDGGRWGSWSDGGGSSLELKDPRSNNWFASNWADSNETGKAEWTTLEYSGRLDNGRGAYDELQILLLGGGECLVDDLFVAEVGGDNRLINAGFEDGLDGWVIQGNHVRSGWSGVGEGFRSERSLHLRATSGGDNGANRVESDFARIRGSRFSNGQNVVIRAKARWLRGHPDILFRIRGNPLELSGRMQVPLNLGTPGAVNSQAESNAGPAIASVSHAPILPQAQEPVQVTAQVFDSDGLANLVLHYRSDREEEYQTAPMDYRGAGAYTAMIPGQASRQMVAFFVEASDAGRPSATTQFPKNPRNRECLVRFGEEALDSGFGTYRLWIGNQNLQTWQRREKLSNELIDSTFVYGDFRAVYNARGRFRGSPFIRPRYNNPASSQPTAMIVVFPEDDLFLGANKVNLDGLEQPGRDNTLQRERMSYWIANQMNLPFSHQRYVQFLVNGTRKGQVFTDSQHPSSEYVSTWFPNQREGELFKIDDWFEFNDAVGREFNENAKLRRYESEGMLKLARYRWSWEKKPNGGLDDDHGSLFDLVEALNTRGDGYELAVDSIVDVEQWMRIFVVRHIVGDWDGYGYNRGKNMSAYKPEDGKWKMILWDLDFSLGGGSHGATHSMFQVDDPTIGRMYNHPAFRRAYLRAWQDAVDGPLSEESSSPELDAVYNAFRANGVTAASPSGTKSWIRSRRNYLLRELDRENASFEITTNSGNEFSSQDNLAVLAGTAPIAVKTIQVNGAEYPIEWTSAQSWRMRIPLQSGVNSIRLEGFDLRGNKVEGGEDAIRVSFGGERQNPADYLTINELMYNPAIPGAGFIEIYNASQTHSFDLSDYILRGVDFRFDDGFVIEPEGYAVVVSDLSVFSTAYGASISIAGEFGGRLSNSGETIRLESETTDEANLLIDQVAYEDKPPWPLLADGQGSSLQLVDPSADNRRVAHWTVVEDSAPMTGPKTLVSMTDSWRYDQSGTDRGTSWRAPNFVDSAWTSGQALLYVENDDLPAEKNTQLTIGKPTYYFRKKFSVNDVEGMELDAYLIVDDGAIVYLNGVEVLRIGMNAGDVSFGTFASRTVTNAEGEGPFSLSTEALVEGENVLAVEVHQTNANSSDVVFGMSLIGTVRGGEAATPGRQNSNRREATDLPLLWLNEAQAINRNGIVDGQGEADPWVEIYNSSEQTLSLGQLYLTSDYDEPTLWKFPDEATIPPGEYRIIWCDGESDATQTDEWHANFRLPLENGSVAISMRSSYGLEIVDYLNYGDLQPDRSFGAFPNGSPDQRRLFLTSTPGEANEDRVPPSLSVFINEWMADNTDFLADPLDGEFDDWFELYNAGMETVDLSGFLLSDDPANLEGTRIPNGTMIGPKSHLLVWADEKAPQTGTPGDLHVEFRLSQGEEVLLLSTPNGTILDQVEFVSQEPNLSSGRLPDGSETIATLPNPTPGSANVVNPEPNRPPVLSPAPDFFVEEGEVFHFDVSAFVDDPDGDDSLLRYEFASTPPEGAQINPNTGEIAWTTSEKDGPGRVVFEVLATDSGNPPLTGTAAYGLQIQEVNLPPVLSELGDRTLSLGTVLNVPLQASDPDIPAQSLQFALVGQTPAGAFINPQTNIIIWEPSTTGTFTFEASVTDDGSPPLTATQSFKVTVISASSQIQLILQPAGEKNISFEWKTERGVRYVVETLSDLNNSKWRQRQIVSAISSLTRFFDTVAEGGQRFYRVRRLAD